MQIGENIQTRRKQKGWSQSELADKLNVSRQTVSKWELGETLPDTENVLKLCSLFEIGADTLLQTKPAQAAAAMPPVLPQDAKKQNMRWAIALLVFGILTVGVLLTVSQFVPSRMKVEQYITAADTQSLTEDSTPSEPRTVYSYISTTGLLPFLNTYYLHWLFLAGIGGILSGIILFIRTKRKTRLHR